MTTARTINGTSFDGSSNITTQQWGQGRNITIDGVIKSIDGSANVDFNTINFYRVSLIRGEVYTHYGCTRVGEKQLIKLSTSGLNTAPATIKIQGQGVKQFVMFFQNVETTYTFGFPARGVEIDANGSTQLDYKENGFVFIVGVSN